LQKRLYTLGTVELPGTPVEEFMGGYGSGGLSGNTDQDYTVTVPEPAVIFLLGQGLLIFSIFGRHCKVKICFAGRKQFKVKSVDMMPPLFC
jgi:hypothetical protein